MSKCKVAKIKNADCRYAKPSEAHTKFEFKCNDNQIENVACKPRKFQQNANA